ncbi:hypothetical protein BN2476_110104 [Paraburkholderia piptadeniae]|uniref:Uncharacterized protein n=1 Tax=Paraburkholderia piptadeniae TaxID=1701573 RepID=A0A1N7RPU3_9BURK|nr:hypothetical protein BN2476_110104 [Paraburkholderia piptadeniae]
MPRVCMRQRSKIATQVPVVLCPPSDTSAYFDALSSDLSVREALRKSRCRYRDDSIRACGVHLRWPPGFANEAARELRRRTWQHSAR